ncbi:MAG: lysine--tRNA ligase [Actinobacteria bacterium]|nr:lysine--tRNA ligase [Actinomycetota bacterium]
MVDEKLEDLFQARADKVKALRDAGVDPYPVAFERTHTAKQIKEKYDAIEPETETGERAAVAGRLMMKRSIGKLAFGVLRDATGDIQLFCEKVRLNQDFDLFDDLDLGDWVGAEGEIVKTKRGELSVRPDKVVLLGKALRPLPEKWHGLQNVEQRYRQRYLDLVVNEDARRILETRSLIIIEMRAYLADQGFIEVETPMLQPTPGGALAKPFKTHMNALDLDLYLRVAPELYLKRLIIGGIEKVFEINRNFRNEGVSVKYNPEFTMLEAYQAYTDYHGMMELMENMIGRVAERVLGTTDHTYQGRAMPLGAPFPRRRLIDLAGEAIERELDLDMPIDELRKIATDAEVHIEPSWGGGKIVVEIYEKHVEGKLFEPTFVMDFPRETSPLARPHRTDPRFTEHFDLVIAGMEVGPAYSELTDPADQRARFQDQARQRAAGDDEAMLADEDFLRALEYGMPPTGGLGFGVDRFTMILTDSPSIREVILFPLLRPET